MKVCVSGATGWIGGYVVKSLTLRGCAVVYTLDENPEAVIDLAWGGLPNYEDELHFGNIGWKIEFLRHVVARGITNITIAGTCLETVDNPPPYALAKLAYRALAFELLPTIKWARLWYLWGKGQREDTLLPRLKKAVAAGEQKFSVIDGERDFIEVNVAAAMISEIAMGDSTGIIDVCSGVATPVEEFCKRHAPNMSYIKDYPAPYYEPFSFHGERLC